MINKTLTLFLFFFYQAVAGCLVYKEACSVATSIGQGFFEGLTGGETIPSGNLLELLLQELAKREGKKIDVIDHD